MKKTAGTASPMRCSRDSNPGKRKKGEERRQREK